LWARVIPMADGRTNHPVSGRCKNPPKSFHQFAEKKGIGYYAPLQVVDEVFCLIVEKDIRASKAMAAEQGRETLMIQSEKMASVGQLAVGVAHEINNPAGYVTSDLHTLADYQQDIASLVKANGELVTQLSVLLETGEVPHSLSACVGHVHQVAKARILIEHRILKSPIDL
jgi:signal transduction histidine kinase